MGMTGAAKAFLIALAIIVAGATSCTVSENWRIVEMARIAKGAP